jgi:hypothetical protein
MLIARFLLFLVSATLVLASPLVNQCAQAGTFGTVATYDSPSNSNTVDTDTGGLVSFSADVATAYGLEQGGVVDFLAGFGTSLNPSSVSSNFTIDFGIANSKSLSVASTDGLHIYTNNVAGQVTPISDTQAFLTDSDFNFSLAFGPITGGDMGEAIAEVGFTILSRNVGGDAVVNVTANFSGGGSSSINGEVIGSALGSDDTFFHFAAPTGESITSLDFVNNGTGTDLQRRLPIDDFGFITTSFGADNTPVPEPTTIAVWSLLGFGLVSYRRLRRK